MYKGIVRNTINVSKRRWPFANCYMSWQVQSRAVLCHIPRTQPYFQSLYIY